MVGRITGLVDCKWEKKGLGIRDWGLEEGSRTANLKSEIPNPKSLVALGDRFALAAGLMEITYDTGARVILQGPVTYSVEINGGYLAIGKLTGKLGKRGGGSANHQIPNPKSKIVSPSPLSSLLSPLFVIRTPTATVTDLGTEFGVEVDKNGAADVEVYQGEVITRPCPDTGDASAVRVTKGHALRIERSGKERTLAVVEIAPHGTPKFVRSLRSYVQTRAESYKRIVLADKPAYYWTFDEPRGNAWNYGYGEGGILAQHPWDANANRAKSTINGGGLSLGRSARDIFWTKDGGGTNLNAPADFTSWAVEFLGQTDRPS